jgi:translation initiation factor 1
MILEFENELNIKKVIIQVQKRNGRQNLTIISDLAEDLDLKKICKYLKKTLNCGGNILKDEQLGEIIRLTGDQKKEVFDFLVREEIYKEADIIVKGF